LLHPGAVAGADEDALLDPGVPAALQVDQFVPDHVGLAEVQAKLVPGIEEKFRTGFAAAAGLLWRFGREVDLLKAHAFRREHLAKPGVDSFHVLEGVIAPADAGLIGDDDEEEAGGA